MIISSRGRQHSINSLPKWAQEVITDLMGQRDELRKLISQLELRAASQSREPERKA